MENDSITRYNSSNSSPVPLSPARQTAIQSWRERPTQYYSMLPTATPRKMIEADTPTLWEIRREIGYAATVAILVKAFIHAAKLVNLDKNLTTEQIGEAANDTLNDKGYLKVEEIKFLLKRAMRTQNVYGRLDYNTLMNWIEEYDTERTEEAIRLSDHKEAQALNEHREDPDAISFREYLEQLKERAKTDKDAAKLLAEAEEPGPRRLNLLSREERQQRKKEFDMWREFEYNLKKRQ